MTFPIEKCSHILWPWVMDIDEDDDIRANGEFGSNSPSIGIRRSKRRRNNLQIMALHDNEHLDEVQRLTNLAGGSSIDVHANFQASLLASASSQLISPSASDSNEHSVVNVDGLSNPNLSQVLLDSFPSPLTGYDKLRTSG